MAAGQGFKTFATGDVLSAADVNGYLMQGVLVFADSAERDAEITSPEEGQFAYLKDTNVTTYYTGSTWANLDTTGMTNPMTTTGDVIYSSSGSTPARLGIGTAGQVLQVNSGATAPEWATPASSSPTFVGVNATRTNVSTTLTANGSYLVAFNTEEYDTNGFHDNSTNNSRITIPAGYGGKYQMSVWMVNPFGTPGSYQLFQIYKNGGQLTASGIREGTYARQVGATNQPFSFSQTVSATAGDYFEVYYVQNNAETVNLWFNFQMSYLGA